MKRFKKYMYLILLIVAGGFLCVYGFTLAKYVTNSVWDYYLKSKGFYFSSDYLGPNTVKNVNNLWDGGSVHFNVKNNLNDAVMTNYDIDYRATCTIEGEAASHTECYINGTDSNTVDGVLSSFEACSNPTDDGVDVSLLNKTDCELGGYDWENQVAIKDLYFDIALTDSNYDLKDVIVNVTATSTSSYSKTLSGKFILHKSNIGIAGITMDYENYSNYDRLVISNSYSSAKCVKITWSTDKFIIDTEKGEFSSYETDANGYVNQIRLNINAKDSLSYIYFRRDADATYDVTDFQMEESSGC